MAQAKAVHGPRAQGHKKDKQVLQRRSTHALRKCNFGLPLKVKGGGQRSALWRLRGALPPSTPAHPAPTLNQEPALSVRAEEVKQAESGQEGRAGLIKAHHPTPNQATEALDTAVSDKAPSEDAASLHNTADVPDGFQSKSTGDVTLAEGSNGGGQDYDSCIQELRADLRQLYEQLEEERALTRQKEAAVIERDALVRDCEGQLACEFWCKRRRERVMPEGSYPELLQPKQVLSSTLEARIRERCPSLLKDGLCDWRPSSFSSAVCQLATTAETMDADVLGQGKTSVIYGELLMQSGQRVPAAFKRLAYDTPEERTFANAELAGLKDADGCPHIVQCYGVFNDCCPETGKQCIHIAMQCVEGLDLLQACKYLESQADQPGFTDILWQSTKLVMQQLLQALAWLHKQGRGHCDVKYANIRMSVNMDGSFKHLTLVDLGGSVKYKGLVANVPSTCQCSVEYCCPEFDKSRTSGSVDACAQDIWSAGYVAVRLVCSGRVWQVASSNGELWPQLRPHHQLWAASYTDEEPLHPKSHVIMWHVWQRVRCKRRFFALAAFLRNLLHPGMNARATVQEALEDDFWATA
ncbi:regulator of ime2 [Trebouxia sp. C0009 RCD-2024]